MNLERILRKIHGDPLGLGKCSGLRRILFQWINVPYAFRCKVPIMFRRILFILCVVTQLREFVPFPSSLKSGAFNFDSFKKNQGGEKKVNSPANGSQKKVAGDPRETSDWPLSMNK